MTRPSWDDHFMNIAHTVSEMATCDRKHVGAVLVDTSKRIIATGFNGSPRGTPHCDEVGHELMEINGRQSCVRTLHAESNAIDYAGKAAGGCILYTTVIPCYDCAKRIVGAGIWRVIWDEYYESRNTEMVIGYFNRSGVQVA